MCRAVEGAEPVGERCIGVAGDVGAELPALAAAPPRATVDEILRAAPPDFALAPPEPAGTRQIHPALRNFRAGARRGTAKRTAGRRCDGPPREKPRF